jgi:hypothetical protein
MGVYEEENVQWVHKIVNTMKWDLSQQDFINVCHEVASKHPKSEFNILVDGNVESENDEYVSEWEISLWAQPKPFTHNEIEEPDES